MQRTVLAALFLGLAGAMAAVPAFADSVLYSNGSDSFGAGYNISLGNSVTDSFTLSQASTITGVDFTSLLISGDTPSSVEWSIGTSAFGGTAETVSPASSFLGADESGVDVGYSLYEESFSIPSLTLDAGTYWITLQSALVSAPGYPAYWDSTFGSSLAFADSDESIPSQSFEILGSPSAVTPEPGSFLLLGSGLLGLAGLLKRRRIA